MKNLSRVLVISFMTLFLYQANAQTFEIKGGLNLANVLDKENEVNYSADYSLNPGFHFGLTVDLPLNDYLSFEPGLLFTTKGFKFEGDDQTSKINLNYLDMPLTIKASRDFGGLKLFGVLGPYVGFGLRGKAKTTSEYQGRELTEEEDLSFGRDIDEDALKRLDMGLTFGSGVEVKSISVRISYDLGLSNNALNTDNGATIKNRVLRSSLGYIF